MHTVAQWAISSIPLFYAATSNLKGVAKSVSLWVYSWFWAGLLAFALWHRYQTWKVASAIDGPYYQAGFPSDMVWIAALAVFLMVLPIVWHFRDLRAARTRTVRPKRIHKRV